MGYISFSVGAIMERDGLDLLVLSEKTTTKRNGPGQSPIGF
jgi:hypothetical protein